jgi:hypothetical protein
MNEDMPWVNLTQEEVEELRNKKQELTEYGKQRLKELMNKDLTFKTNGKETFSIPSQTLENLTLGTKAPETKLEVKEMTHEEMLEIAEKREAENRPFYRFFAIEYFATGEGMSFWLKVCRNYPPHDGRDYDLERFAKFIGEGAEYYLHGLETPTQEEFMEKYANLIPPYIVKMIERRDQPGFDWETHLYFNYS